MSFVPEEVRGAVVRRSGGVCERCGQRRATAIHHKLPRSAGGDHSLANLAALCSFSFDGVGFSEGCHEHVHANPTESYSAGWLIRRSA